ncbi:transposase [Streptomyces yangpuensis]|uniref:transposase n=1 Tax=Streptomyces yangpuensis TaxID=1648182 RepID=UPI003654E7D4
MGEAGRDPEPPAAVIDAQSLRAAVTVPAATRGYDGAKKVPGRKRHTVVDCLGLPPAVMVTAANVTDRDAAMPLLERVRARCRRTVLVWADGGYAGRLGGWATGRLGDWAKQQLGLALEIVKRSDDASGFVALPGRWVVERTPSRLMRSRRPVRDYETLPAVHEQMVLWSMTMLMSRRLVRRRE